MTFLFLEPILTVMYQLDFALRMNSICKDSLNYTYFFMENTKKYACFISTLPSAESRQNTPQG